MEANWRLNRVSVAAEDRSSRLLHELNAEFRAGQITLLIGANGAGKSTLLETLAGLRPLAEGDIALGEGSLWDKDRKKRLRSDVLLQFGLAMQHAESQWFASNARDEMIYSMKPYEIAEAVEQDRRIVAALEALGLPEKVLEQDPWSLSGGQQRRLALACLHVCRPRWLLLDEPTAGLDANGRASLCGWLESHRASGGGAILVTHDLETLLPLADTVMIVENGCVREAKPEELPIREKPSEAAERMVKLARQRQTSFSESEREQADTEQERINHGVKHGLIEASFSTEYSGEIASSSAIKRKRRIWQDPQTFDPRTVVIAYLLMSAVLFLQNSMLQLAASSFVVAIVVAPFWPLIRQWVPVIRGYAVLTVILIVIGGLSLQPLLLEWDRMETTAIRLVQLLLIMVLGMPILGLMTPLRLQRALDQTFGWLSKLGVPVPAMTLLVTLIFRFIPLLMREWGRFAKLARARGKETKTAGGVPARRLFSMLIPYLRAILRLAEEMAAALEARGFGRARQAPVYGFKLKPGLADAWLLGAALIGCGLLFLAHRLL